jgi:hypothetical protein
MMSLDMTCWRVALWVSTVGGSPVMVIVSSTPPTRSSALTVMIASPLRRTSSRLNGENPESVKVTV